MPPETYMQRIESFTMKSCEESLHKYEIEREITEINREAAKIGLEAAKIGLGAMKARAEMEKVETAERVKLAQASIQHYREYQRPSHQPGVEVRQEAGQWVMELGGVRAIGDTPAIAASEFDHLWVFGEAQ